MVNIILPNTPLFNETLALATPFDWLNRDSPVQKGLVVDSETGLFRLADHAEIIEYLCGGESELIEQNNADC